MKVEIRERLTKAVENILINAISTNEEFDVTTSKIMKDVDQVFTYLQLKSSDTEKARELLGVKFESYKNESGFSIYLEKEQAEFICSLLNKAQGYE